MATGFSPPPKTPWRHSAGAADGSAAFVARTLLVGDEPRDIVFAQGHAFIATPLKIVELFGDTPRALAERFGTQRDPTVPTEIPARRPRDQLDCSARRVAAEQRTLRPLENLNPLQVEQIELRPLHAWHVYTVDIHADRRITRDHVLLMTE